jgi:general stress protein 26
MVMGRGAAHRLAQLLGRKQLARRTATRHAGLGIRHDGALWFSSSRQSRKARNLAADPRCVVTTENAVEPVVIEGAAEVVTDPQALTRMLALENAKYQTDYSMELLDPAVNATIRVQPRWAFGLAEGDFTGSPTRWIFQPERA